MNSAAHSAHIVQIPATTKSFSISTPALKTTLITGRFYLFQTPFVHCLPVLSARPATGVGCNAKTFARESTDRAGRPAKPV
jgi:hypothetical protein